MKTASTEVLKKRAERFGLTTSPISSQNLSKAEQKEKLEKRKERFGLEEKTAVAVDDKKRLRAERFSISK
ncbi:SAP domain-containing ribonucleoprotein [Blattella germanica]|nr:SAP domain-containing ribonucleoprotein [Blattella germanica]